MNQILVDGGFAPEWIMLKRDIIDQQERLRKHLQCKCEELFLDCKAKSNNIKSNENLKTHTNSADLKEEWKRYCERLEQENETLKLLNKQIDKYNLIVPLMKSQMFHFNLLKEANIAYDMCVAKLKKITETLSEDSSYKSKCNIDGSKYNIDTEISRMELLKFDRNFTSKLYKYFIENVMGKKEK